MKKHWYDYLWIASLLYLLLGFFNILFAWLGLLCFFIPLIISVVSGTKSYCNRYCGRGQLFGLLGGRFGLSRRKDIPKWMKSKAFRCGFRLFLRHVLSDAVEHLFGVRRCAGSGAGGHPAVDLQAALELGLPRHPLPSRRGAGFSASTFGVAQFAFGFYGVMLTSTVLGLITMVLFKPRSLCVYCPMGTMTQLICKARNSRT